ncbi:BMC domain-containing protein [Vagococcus sp.]|uniref:BMC domain-containing protein n=1 Tax=Vagococcus sp. TaxID=1933889 RepID=UPI003F9B62A2
MKKSLGMIELSGYVAAIEISDVCLKASNVELIGIEKVKGQGKCLVLFEGDIGAVNAAIDAGMTVAKRSGKFRGSGVIAKPVDDLLTTFDTEKIKKVIKKEKSDLGLVKEMKSEVVEQVKPEKYSETKELKKEDSQKKTTTTSKKINNKKHNDKKKS